MSYKTKNFHYAWVICVLGAMLIFISMGIVSNGFSMYLPYLIREYDFTNSQTSFLVNIRCMVSFLAMICIGKYYKIFSIRVGTTIAAACACLAFAVYGISENYLVFCVGAAISGVSYGLGSMIPISILMNNWFARSKAFALGICAMGSSFAAIFMPPLIELLVSRFTIRNSFFIESLGILVLVIVIGIFMRNTPEEKGLLPYGSKSPVKRQMESGDSADQEKHIMPLSVWVFIGGASLCMGILANPGFSHLSVLYTTEGYRTTTAAFIISAMGLILTIAKPLYGTITDRIGTLKACTVFGILLLLGYIMCCLSFTGSMLVCLLNIICMGLGFPIATIGISVWAGDLAPKKHYAKVVRRLQVIYAGGALCCASVPGIMADHFGSYIPAYILFSVLLAIAILFILLAYRQNDRIDI